jgi:hypothetical protein
VTSYSLIICFTLTNDFEYELLIETEEELGAMSGSITCAFLAMEAQEQR